MQAVGTQNGRYNDGLMSINRNTRIDTNANAVDTEPVFGQVVTISALTNVIGVDPATITTYAILNDSRVCNAPEDYMEVNQYTQLYDGDHKINGNVGYESISATTGIDGRIFSHGGAASFEAAVITTSDGATNASSAVQAGITKHGEIDMTVGSTLIDDATNVESARTVFTVIVPDLSNDVHGYTEQSTGYVNAFAALNGIDITTMQTVFENVDYTKVTGHFYAVTT